MTEQSQIDQIKELAVEFFDKTKIAQVNDVKVFFVQENNDFGRQTIALDIVLSEPQIFIGQQGQTLIEVQRLLRIILNKKLKENFSINLDINGYKRKKTQNLEYLAEEKTNEALKTGREIQLPVMPAFERRIIHSILANRSDVETESRGQEPERYIVIKPKSAL